MPSGTLPMASATPTKCGITPATGSRAPTAAWSLRRLSSTASSGPAAPAGGLPGVHSFFAATTGNSIIQSGRRQNLREAKLTDVVRNSTAKQPGTSVIQYVEVIYRPVRRISPGQGLEHPGGTSAFLAKAK